MQFIIFSLRKNIGKASNFLGAQFHAQHQINIRYYIDVRLCIVIKVKYRAYVPEVQGIL